jgi:cyclophilin family peptidyl-prolyl cis-trans isomerase
MYFKLQNIFFFFTLFLLACNNDDKNLNEVDLSTKKTFKTADDLTAVFYTKKGNIEIGLEYVKTPLTVANFVGLAEGQISNVHKSLGVPYYDGLSFHRVIKDFMAQGGCPSGNGTGNAGYQFDDEFHEELTHDEAGVLSMANSGPNTNSSQFFITYKSTPWLDGVHSVFGKVLKGIDVLNQIEASDKIDSIRIFRKSENAKAFNAPLVFETQKEIIKQRKIESIKSKYAIYQKNDLYKYFEEYVKKTFPNAIKTPSGLYYVKSVETNNEQASAGRTVKVHYIGKHTNGEVFDQSVGKQPFDFPLGQGMVIPGWEEGIALLKKGEKATFIIPPYLAYGEQGMPPVIKSNETLIFEVELLGIY